MIITQQLPNIINKSLILLFNFYLDKKVTDFNYLTISQIILGGFLMLSNGIKIIITLNFITQKLNIYKSNIYIKEGAQKRTH